MSVLCALVCLVREETQDRYMRDKAEWGDVRVTEETCEKGGGGDKEN